MLFRKTWLRLAAWGLFLLPLSLSGQFDVTYALANPTVGNDGTDFFQADVLVSSSTPFIMGSGQLYLEYNPAAFGEQVSNNGRIQFLQPGNSILGVLFGNPPFASPGYRDFIVNDDSATRVSVSWQQNVSGECFPGVNVTTTPTLLCQLRFDFVLGGAAAAPDLCFGSAGNLADQTFTACGGATFCQANCTGPTAGTRIFDDNFICFGSLPVELLHFSAVARKQDAWLSWTTVSERNSSHFSVEKSTDGTNWAELGVVPAAGDSRYEEHYDFVDPDFATDAREVYYRLRLEDRDGSFTYSDIRSVSGETLSGATGWRVFPNPASEVVNVVFTEEADVSRELSLHSLTGAVVRRSLVSAETPSQSFDLRGLPAGVYLLRSSSGGTRRIILR